jgi:hypothetical protein
LWTLLSNRTGELEPPAPNRSRPAAQHASTVTQQTAAVVMDLDGDRLTDFVIGERTAAPAIVSYRRHANGWTRGVVDAGALTIEAGACAADLDGDGDLDLVAGGDASSAFVWW